jgi:hypothetical protein
MRLFLALFFSYISFTLFAQTLTISGKVADKSTGEPLPFASIGIKGKPINSITNMQGEFDFHLPAEYRNEILVISMLGYPNYEAPVWSLLENTSQVILMEKVSTVLEEVVVADSLTGPDIIRIAISKVNENYPLQPFVLEGFYRDIKKVGGTYIRLRRALPVGKQGAWHRTEPFTAPTSPRT